MNESENIQYFKESDFFKKTESFLHYAQGPSDTDYLTRKDIPSINDERFYKLTNELRCLVCQNQTVADSNSDLAVDLRKQVAEQISYGKSDDEILEYMEERYGEFILYNPQKSFENIGLWIGPFLVLFIAILIAANTVKSYSKKTKRN